MNNMARRISDTMMKELREGILAPILEVVKKDSTLDLELRGGSINIYYRGGSLFRITEQGNTYLISFDTKYCSAGGKNLSSSPSIAYALEELPYYKQAMDWWFGAQPKYEREFQQVIVRENNSHRKISNGTDYYIVDIEYVDANARFDMVALKWLSRGAVRKDSSKISLAMIEVKYGDGALNNASGIQKHLKDFQVFLSDAKKVDAFCQDMSCVFKQKCELGLINGLKQNQYENISISMKNPEVIFIFANHDPDSKILENVLCEINPFDYTFPIFIANAVHMGYGLYVDNMMTLEGWQESFGRVNRVCID